MDSDDNAKTEDPEMTILFTDTSRTRSSRMDDIWFYVNDQPDNEMILPEARPVSVGRGRDQDIVIGDQTVSREHLVLIRKETDVHILVKGANGLVVDGYRYRSGEEVTIRPIKSFELGRVTCTFRNDDTLIIHRDDIAPFVDPPDPTDHDIPGGTPIRQGQPNVSFESCENAEYNRQNLDVGRVSGKSLLDHDQRHSGKPGPLSHESFAPHITSSDPHTGKAGHWLYIIPCGAAVFLMIAISTFIWKQHLSDEPVKTVPHNVPVTMQSTHHGSVVPTPGPGPVKTVNNDYDKSLIDRAETLIQRKEWETARDYLIDISQNSIYYDKAQQMIMEISRKVAE